MKYVHIAGTNGKGSVTEYIYRILMAAGKRTGCFTSPHLVSPTERMRIDERMVSEEELDALLEEVKQQRLAVNDTLFAAYTAAALLWFERQGAEYAVIETGIGGRRDSTNVITPCVSVLTPIDYDHMALLGDTLTQIAYDKSGIIKRGVPVISAVQQSEAMTVIEQESSRMDAPLTVAPPVRIISASVLGQTLEMEGREYAIRAIGRHQPQNAALAVKAAQVLGISNDAIRKGLQDAVLRCRTQFAPGEPDILIDGAHNTAAAKALCASMDDYFADRKKVLLFACMKDKDYTPMIRTLAPHFSQVIVTRAGLEREEDPETLREQFGAYTRCTAQPDTFAAFEQAKTDAKDAGAMLVVCGSFYLAGRIEPLVVNNAQH
jgi:dihydrofolate synthase/folylpolyglutamate synthase